MIELEARNDGAVMSSSKSQRHFAENIVATET